MNLFHEAKKVLDKDGKVNPLGPYGKMKLTGQEVANYFRKNKVSDAKVKRAVEVALDMSGAMDIASKEIKKFYGDKVLKSKEVQNALQYANESFTLNQTLNQISEENLVEKNLIPDIQKIVDTKGAAKVGGIMVDMFTASMINQIYNKVNDQNKKRMEKSNISTLVDIAQRMMQKSENNPLEEETLNEISQGAMISKAIDIAVSMGGNMTGAVKRIEAIKKGLSKNKNVKKALQLANEELVGEAVNESVMDAYRQMWEDGEKYAPELVEVTDKEINAMKQLSKDMEKIKKDYFKIAKMGDKTLQLKGFNTQYEAILKAQQEILKIIGDMSTMKSMSDRAKKNEEVELEEKLSKADLKMIDQMYDKKGNLTDIGKAVMNYKPGDNISKIVQNLNNKK